MTAAIIYYTAQHLSPCISPISHLSLTSLSPLSHLSLSPLSHLSLTSLSHLSLICLSPLCHLSLTYLCLSPILHLSLSLTHPSPSLSPLDNTARAEYSTVSSDANPCSLTWICCLEISP